MQDGTQGRTKSLARLIRAADASYQMAEADRPGGAGGLNAALRRAARWLELRSFGLTPEHFTLSEGLRAAFAVAVPLLLVLLTGQHQFGWSVYAAFWLCLCDIAGPDGLRRRLLLIFVLVGTVIAFAGAWAASFGWAAAMIAGTLLVFLAIALPYRLAHSAMLATLLAVVAVVAVGYPEPVDKAAILAFAFFAGSLWAYLLIVVFWRIDPLLPLKQDTVALYARLADMAFDLAATGNEPHRDARWHPEHAAHRRSVRIAIERLRLLLARYDGPAEASVAPTRRLLKAGEATFNALIALEHGFITGHGAADERIAVAKLLRNTLIAAQMTVAGVPDMQVLLARRLKRLGRARATIDDPMLAGILEAVRLSLLPLTGQGQARPLSTLSPPPLPGFSVALRQGIRQAACVLFVYSIARLFGLGYPYWAAMATVVVLQGNARITWTRSIERVLGSLTGGFVALALLELIDARAILVPIAVLLTGWTIALRTVNYTVFVVTLTMLFIFVTELLTPGAGIASARILDNTLGSLAAVLAVLLLWPERGPGLPALIDKGLASNGAYLEAVRQNVEPESLEETRRAAGLASIAAEVALHDLGGLTRRWYRLDQRHSEALRSLRLLAGEAASAWHKRLGGGDLSRDG
ncbi:FUSC family protein [Rhizobium rhizosphaerae]|nr:FUSC family protein [Xaviernesmea rhizosphaerae]